MRSEEEFNLLEWDIHYELAQLTDSDTRAECTRNTDYRQAWIKFDPSHCDTYEQAYEACVHEVFHIVAAPLDVLWAGRSRTSDEDGRWHAGLEPLITKLERFYARKFRKFEDYFTDEGDFKEQPTATQDDKPEKTVWDVALPNGYTMHAYVVEQHWGADSHVMAIRRDSDGIIYKFCTPTQDDPIPYLKSSIKNHPFFRQLT